MTRSAAFFVVVVVGLAASGLSEVAGPALAYARHLGDHAPSARALFLLWSAAYLGSTSWGLWGAYRALRTGSPRHRALLAYVVAAGLYLGTEGWSHSFTPSVSFVVNASWGWASLGVNVTGLVLWAWYARVAGRPGGQRAAPGTAGATD